MKGKTTRDSTGIAKQKEFLRTTFYFRAILRIKNKVVSGYYRKKFADKYKCSWDLVEIAKRLGYITEQKKGVLLSFFGDLNKVQIVKIIETNNQIKKGNLKLVDVKIDYKKVEMQPPAVRLEKQKTIRDVFNIRYVVPQPEKNEPKQKTKYKELDADEKAYYINLNHKLQKECGVYLETIHPFFPDVIKMVVMLNKEYNIPDAVKRIVRLRGLSPVKVLPQIQVFTPIPVFRPTHKQVETPIEKPAQPIIKTKYEHLSQTEKEYYVAFDTELFKKYSVRLENMADSFQSVVAFVKNKTNIGFSVDYIGRAYKLEPVNSFWNKVAEKTSKKEEVNHPNHYADGKIEVIDFIEDKSLGFNLGNSVKYISRAGKKDPEKTIQDLEKARWYLTREIERLLKNLTDVSKTDKK